MGIFIFLWLLTIPLAFAFFSGGAGSRNNHPVSPVALESRGIYENHVINSYQGPYEYGPEDSFTGTLTIIGYSGSPITVIFAGSSFDGTDLIISGEVVVIFSDACDVKYNLIDISWSADVTFIENTIDVGKFSARASSIVNFLHCTPVDIYESWIYTQSSVYYLDCVVTIPEIEPHPMAGPHRFQVYYASVTIEESNFFVYDTLLEIDYSEIVIRANTNFNFNVMLDLSYDSTALIENSIVNGGDIVIADNRPDEDCVSSLTITQSVVNAGILDVEEFSEIIIQGEDTVINSMLKSYFVTGTVIMVNNIITEGEYGIDYLCKSYDFDEASEINYRDVIIAYPDAYLSVDSSYLYGLAASCHVDITNSIIDSIHPNKDLYMVVENSQILGEGGTCQLYGSVSVLGSNIFFESGTNTPLISFINSEVNGIIHPFMDLTVVFQHSSYDEAAMELVLSVVQNLWGKVLFLNLESETDLSIWGWRGATFFGPPGEEIIAVSLTLDGVDYGEGLQFTLDPSHVDLDENHFEIDAFISSQPDAAFSADFIVEIVKTSELSIPEKLEQLRTSILELNDDSFDKNPVQRKNALDNKIQEVNDLIELEDYSGAYDKILHDIKPKLCGIKTNENEIPWGNGVFTNPWIIDSDIQESLRIICNDILTAINSLN